MSPPDLVPARPAAQELRRRTKTFTGCWTCRARKVKCDEGRPTCGQCCHKQVICNGYGSRLQWLTPEIVDLQGRTLSVGGEAPASQALRRVIPPEQPKFVLSLGRIEEILRYIDDVKNETEPNTGTTVIQNFGVFDAQLSHPLQSTITSTGPSHDDVFLDPYQPQGDHDDLGSISTSAQLFDSIISPSTFEDAAALWNFYNLDCSHPLLQSAEPLPNTSPETETNSSLLAPTHESHHAPELPESANDLDHSPQTPVADATTQEKTSYQSWPTHSGQIARSLEPLIIPVQERLLMDHYRNRVLNLFCVVDNNKSPWKKIHLPVVLQCMGELSIGGSSTKIRNALRYALYSVSAFCLSNEHKRTQREDEASKWFDAAIQYRSGAIKRLTSAVENDLYNIHRPSYKEFLSTMLSMITINVMSGDTSSCAVHLDGAEQLIKHMSLRKSRFSRKAHALHRIYLYLRIIYESTAPRSKDRPSTRLLPLLSLSSTDASNQALNSTLHPVFSEGHTQDQGLPDEMSTYECIYGVPRVLLIMLKEAIEVIDMVGIEREEGIVNMSEPLADRCEKLESKILDWHVGEHSLDGDDNGSIDATIIHHQTKAFHNALIVYFSQHVRLLGHRYQRGYVMNILESIEAMEKIKAETNTIAAPLFWPAFIGATEAFEPSMQARFQRWYDGATLYGLAAVRTGIEVIHKVWEEGPSNGRRLERSWRTIVDEGKHTLMLT